MEAGLYRTRCGCRVWVDWATVLLGRAAGEHDVGVSLRALVKQLDQRFVVAGETVGSGDQDEIEVAVGHSGPQLVEGGPVEEHTALSFP